ncbi:hypothetical protein J4H92_14345 [Leucobacter weissii]|uniref:Uncharacterized protein n=1 Tax=Leucobacter weissii TaxID=1983706 RepID=A0A939MM75_9MICO|nr:hypothetical protein [Leucobacter weissii]MBO1903121.1 hypothetical protein [Leucobacter weissii]
MREASDGVQTLLQRDRLEVSADLLVHAFSDLRDQQLPSILLTDLVDVFARRHGLPGKHRRVLAGLPQRDPEAIVLRLVLDVTSSWHAAGIAAPIGSSGDDGNTRIVLTLRGSTALRGEHPHTRVRGLLERTGASRSFID